MRDGYREVERPYTGSRGIHQGGKNMRLDGQVGCFQKMRKEHRYEGLQGDAIRSEGLRNGEVGIQAESS